ncbi:MAG: hypothetical protein FWE53_04115 [Firmicutes bacterium]|nr:hypothetical protein [Bacillota bacterium]
MDLWLIILSFVLALLLIVLVTPIFVRIKAFVNVLGNIGIVSLRLYGLRLFEVRLKFCKAGLVLIKPDGTERLIKMTGNTGMLKLVSELFKQIRISKAVVFSTAGIRNSAHDTALLCGYLISVINTALAVLMNSKTTHAVSKTEPVFNKDELTFAFDVKLSTNILRLLAAVLTAKVKSQKGAGYGKSAY